MTSQSDADSEMRVLLCRGEIINLAETFIFLAESFLFFLLLLLPIVVQGSVQRRIVARWRSGQEE